MRRILSVLTVATVLACPTHLAAQVPLAVPARPDAATGPGAAPLYEVIVASVRMVFGPPEERCWLAPDATGETTGGAATTAGEEVLPCAALPGSGRPEYWDVRYRLHGREYRAHLAVPPGRTLWVDAAGAPRAVTVASRRPAPTADREVG